MEPLSIALIAMAALILFLLVLLFILTLSTHRKFFGKRFMLDPLVKNFVPSEYEGLITEEDSFLVGKATIRGNFYHYENYDKEKLIIYAHGMWSSRESYTQDIEYLAKNGFNVYAFDYYGVQDSDGKNLRGFSQGLKTLDMAIRHVKSLGHENIYLIGHSWGGFNVLAVTKYHPDIRGVVAISPFSSYKNLLIGAYQERIKPAIPFFYFIEFCKNGGYALASPLKSLKNYKKKVFIIHSQDDPVVNYHYATEMLQKKFDENYLIVSGKKHSPHYDQEAVNKLYAYLAKLSSLTSEEEKKKYKETIHFHELGYLDPAVMDKIVSYFKEN